MDAWLGRITWSSYKSNVDRTVLDLPRACQRDGGVGGGEKGVSVVMICGRRRRDGWTLDVDGGGDVDKDGAKV